MPKKKTYSAELCLPCLMCNQESIVDLARVFVLFGYYLRELGKDGIALDNPKLLEEGIVSMGTDDPTMVKHLKPFEGFPHTRHSGGGYKFN